MAKNKVSERMRSSRKDLHNTFRRSFTKLQRLIMQGRATMAPNLTGLCAPRKRSWLGPTAFKPRCKCGQSVKSDMDTCRACFERTHMREISVLGEGDDCEIVTRGEAAKLRDEGLIWASNWMVYRTHPSVPWRTIEDRIQALRVKVQV